MIISIQQLTNIKENAKILYSVYFPDTEIGKITVCYWGEYTDYKEQLEKDQIDKSFEGDQRILKIFCNVETSLNKTTGHDELDKCFQQCLKNFKGQLKSEVEFCLENMPPPSPDSGYVTIDIGFERVDRGSIINKCQKCWDSYFLLTRRIIASAEIDVLERVERDGSNDHIVR